CIRPILVSYLFRYPAFLTHPVYCDLSLRPPIPTLFPYTTLFRSVAFGVRARRPLLHRHEPAALSLLRRHRNRHRAGDSPRGAVDLPGDSLAGFLRRAAKRGRPARARRTALVERPLAAGWSCGQLAQAERDQSHAAVGGHHLRRDGCGADRLRLELQPGISWRWRVTRRGSRMSRG